MLKRLWMDEGGAILSTELILIMVILVIGMSIGLVALRDAVDAQLADVAAAIAAINPAYEWAGLVYNGEGTLYGAMGTVGEGTAPYAWVAGSLWDCGTNVAGDGPIALGGTWGACDILGGYYATGAKDDIVQGNIVP